MRECEVRCGVPKANCVPGAACQHLAPHYAPRTTHFAQREKRPQRAVSRILFPAFAWRRGKRRRSPNARLRRGDDHSSSPVIADGIQRPTRRLRTGRPMAPPYLVLLRAGFCLPPTLRPARCALTAPFHPYLRHADRMPGMSRARLAPRPLPDPMHPVHLGGVVARALRRDHSAFDRHVEGGMFSVPLSFGLPRPGITRRTALRSSDFPLPGARSGHPQASARRPGSGRLARCGRTDCQRTDADW